MMLASMSASATSWFSHSLPCQAAVPFNARTYNARVRMVTPGKQHANLSLSGPRLYSRGKKSIMVADHQKAELWRERMFNVSTPGCAACQT